MEEFERRRRSRFVVDAQSDQCFAELELDERADEARMLEYIEQVLQAAKPLGVRIENGNVNADDIARTARERLFVRVKPVSK